MGSLTIAPSCPVGGHPSRRVRLADVGLPPQERHGPAVGVAKPPQVRWQVMASSDDRPGARPGAPRVRPRDHRRDGEHRARRGGRVRIRLRRLPAGAGQRRHHPRSLRRAPSERRRRTSARACDNVCNYLILGSDSRARLERGRAGPVRNGRGHRRLEPFGRHHARAHRPEPPEGDHPVVPAGPLGRHPRPWVRQDQRRVLGRVRRWRRAARRQDGRRAQRVEDQPLCSTWISPGSRASSRPSAVSRCASRRT